VRGASIPKAHRPIRPALSTSDCRRTQTGDGVHLDVFSYLVDEFERRATPADQVPAGVLTACLTEAEAAEAVRTTARFLTRAMTAPQPELPRTPQSQTPTTARSTHRRRARRSTAR
jgi:hypothetical protein